ncbi:hypothetical protein HYQ46_013184 [Verticillium longisporum]|nr:hypothetical protein HYQ46_013184 [Verticillium longisporum]
MDHLVRFEKPNTEMRNQVGHWCGAWGTNVSPGEPAYKQGTESGGSALYRVQSLCQPSVGQHLATEGQSTIQICT